MIETSTNGFLRAIDRSTTRLFNASYLRNRISQLIKRIDNNDRLRRIPYFEAT